MVIPKKQAIFAFLTTKKKCSYKIDFWDNFFYSTRIFYAVNSNDGNLPLMKLTYSVRQY